MCSRKPCQQLRTAKQTAPPPLLHRLREWWLLRRLRQAQTELPGARAHGQSEALPPVSSPESRTLTSGSTPYPVAVLQLSALQPSSKGRPDTHRPGTHTLTLTQPQPKATVSVQERTVMQSVYGEGARQSVLSEGWADAQLGCEVCFSRGRGPSVLAGNLSSSFCSLLFPLRSLSKWSPSLSTFRPAVECSGGHPGRLPEGRATAPTLGR